MAASREWKVWHLTPRGWEDGDEKMDFGTVEKHPTPPDTVMTCRYQEEMSSVFSKMEKTLDVIWTSPDKEAVDALLAQHGECPRRL